MLPHVYRGPEMKAAVRLSQKEKLIPEMLPLVTSQRAGF